MTTTIKSTLLLVLSLHLYANTFSQTKKDSPAKNSSSTEVQSMPKKESMPADFTSQTAGRYGKSFAKKMYSAIDFQEKKTNYTVSIKRWKGFQIPDTDKWQYFIDITIKWQSGSSGWPTQWTDVEYDGIIMCDEFGCEPFYMIKSKNEPAPGFLNLFAKSSPVEEMESKLKEGIPILDKEWLTGVN